jgi:4-amino-4-deoxy-L-arabinose transferase-like glycosyltransferase
MTDRFRLGRPGFWLLIGLMLAAFALRVYRLEAQSLWSDEGLSLYRSRLTLVENLSNVIVVPPGVPTRDTNPPLYFVVLSGLRLAAGDSEYVLRFVSVLAGVLLVPLLYVTGKRLFAEEAGIFAAILGAFSPFLVWYSQEARMYLLLLTLSVASVYLLLRALNFPAVFSAEREITRARGRDPLWRWLLWIAWAVVTLAALYTHFTTFFLLLFEGMILSVALWRARRREAVMVLIGLGVLAVPLTAYAWSRAQSGVDPVFGFRPLDSIVPEVVGSFLVGRTNEFFQPWWAVLPGLLIFAVGLAGGLIGRRFRVSTLVSALYLSAPLLAFYVVTFVRPLYAGPRHLALLVPPFYLLTALGLMLIWRRAQLVGWIALGAMLIVMGWWLRIQFTDPAYVKDDMRSLACTIAAQAKPNDVVIVQDTITSFVFDYYYTRCDGQAPWKIIPQYPSLNVDSALNSFQVEANQAARLWFVNDPAPLHGFDGAALDIWARGHLLRLDRQRFPSIWLGVAYQLYTAHFPIRDALPEGVPAHHLTWPSDGLRLVGVAPISVAPDRDHAQVDLYWQLDRPAQRNYSFTLRLVDRSGAERGLLIGTAFDNWSARRWPTDKVIQHSATIMLPHGLPSGEYTLRVSVADRQTNEVIPAADGSTEVDAAALKVAP